MTTLNQFSRALLLGSVLSVLVACGGTSTVTKAAASDKQFDNFLVIGIAGDYDNRAHMERLTASGLRQAGASASAYYSIVGGNNPLTKEEVIAVISEHGFDSVLVVRRVQGNVEVNVQEDRTGVDASPIGGRFFNLFRSDYTDYTKPGSVDFETQATLAVELYDVTTQDIVYSFDHETRQDVDVGLLIDEAATAIVRRLDRADMVGGSGS